MKLLYSNQRGFIRDYRLVTDKMGERLDEIIKDRYSRQSIYNVKVSPERLKILKASGKKPERVNLVREIKTELLKENVSLVDSIGRRWTPDRYAKMIARTRTREYTTAAMESQMKNNNFECFQVPQVGGDAEVDDACRSIRGKVFRYGWAKSAAALKYPLCPYPIPVHPNCIDVKAPYILEMEMQ